jgi:hypothetical protein
VKEEGRCTKEAKEKKITCELKRCVYVTKIEVDTEGNEVLRLTHSNKCGRAHL